jgi:aspartate aminotransferase
MMVLAGRHILAIGDRKGRPLRASIEIPLSATLSINERQQARRAAGLPVIPLGFGEAGLPVLPAVAEVLARAATHNAYGPVAGSAKARTAAAGYFGRRGLSSNPDQVILAPGSKALLFALIAALPGDVVLPRPSWVSYAAQAALTGKRVVGVPIPESAGGVPDPARLDDALRAARATGADPKILVLTLPDNPTGTVAGAELLKRVCDLADRHGLVIVSDEIYGDLCYDGAVRVSPASLLPDRTVVTSGLSKNMALGGWRIGFARVPDTTWGATLARQITGIASEIWSSPSAPMQEAAAFVLDEPPSVVDHIDASRRLHRAVATAVHQIFLAVGARCRQPQAAFYVYPDLDELRPALAPYGIHTGQQLANHLLERHGIGVLPGEAFGDDPRALRLRVATSLLYGDGDQRWTALHSSDPTNLPWIARTLTELRTSLTALAKGSN